MSRKQKIHDRNFFNCPGAELGNMPYSLGEDNPRGNITVSIGKLLDAIAFLKRRYNLIETRPSRFEGSVMIVIEARVRS